MRNAIENFIVGIVTWMRNIALFLIVFFMIAMMYAPIVFLSLLALELILPKSMKMKDNLGDYAWFFSVVLAAIFMILSVVVGDLNTLPLYTYLNQQAYEGTLFIYVYMGSGMYLMIAGRSLFNFLGIDHSRSKESKKR